MGNNKPFYLLWALAALTMVFVALKVIHVVEWNWVAVFLPILLPVIGFIVFCVLYLIILFIMSLDNGFKNKN